MNFAFLGNLEPPDFTVGTPQREFGTPDHGIRYSHLTCERAWALIPQSEHKHFCVTLLEARGGRIPPHRDDGIVSTINWYVDVDGSTTQFWNQTGTNRYQVGGQRLGHIYSEDSIEPADSFVAKRGDIWVLDVSTIHSVEMTNPTHVRQMIAMGSPRYSVEEIKEMIWQDFTKY